MQPVLQYCTGTALATAGEDGTVKIWSRNGMLRSSLSQNDSPVYSIVWGADSDQLCYSTGSNIIIRSSQSSAKQTMWKAHEGVVLKVCVYVCVCVCVCVGGGVGCGYRLD